MWKGGGPTEERCQGGSLEQPRESRIFGPADQGEREQGAREGGGQELRETFQQQERRGGVATKGEQGQAKGRVRVGASERRNRRGNAGRRGLWGRRAALRRAWAERDAIPK